MDRHLTSTVIRVPKSLLEKMKIAGIPTDHPGERMEMIFNQAVLEGMDFSQLFPLDISAGVDKTSNEV